MVRDAKKDIFDSFICFKFYLFQVVVTWTIEGNQNRKKFDYIYTVLSVNVDVFHFFQVTGLIHHLYLCILNMRTTRSQTEKK